jgi:2'-5' RNA ligase
MPRLFCAVALPPHLRLQLADLVKPAVLKLREDPASGWTSARLESPDKFHITLKFYGDVPEGKLPELKDALRAAASRHEPFSLNLDYTGYFPPSGAPRVFWMGVTGPDGGKGLQALQRDVEANSVRAGFEAEPKKFHPHITLARFRPEKGRFQRLDVQAMPLRWDVSWMVLVQSTLGPGGSTYRAIEQFPLGGNMLSSPAGE